MAIPREKVYEMSLELHRRSRGKIAVESKVPVESTDDLSLAYTPGVAEPCREIVRNPSSLWEVTSKGNMVLVATDGTAVLGLGDIGPEAALPVMEGKCVLFKRFAGVDAFPLCVRTKDPDEFVHVVSLLEPVFGGVNLEDISAPRCFEIERKLQERVNIPVFHDDQHGTAVVVLAALSNALKVVGKRIDQVRIVINGMGAAGMAIARLLLAAGARNVVGCGRHGVLEEGQNINWAHREILPQLNPEGIRGSLADALRGADVFVGVSVAGAVKPEWVSAMAPRAVVMAMANPTPEIFPEEAKSAGAYVVATGRSDFPNQVNNCLGFPGIFRGLLDVRARRVTEGIKLAAARAIADLVGDQLSPDYIIPSALDPRVAPAVARAVAEQAVKEGVAQVLPQ